MKRALSAGTAKVVEHRMAGQSLRVASFNRMEIT